MNLDVENAAHDLSMECEEMSAKLRLFEDSPGALELKDLSNLLMAVAVLHKALGEVE